MGEPAGAMVTSTVSGQVLPLKNPHPEGKTENRKNQGEAGSGPRGPILPGPALVLLGDAGIGKRDRVLLHLFSGAALRAERQRKEAAEREEPGIGCSLRCTFAHLSATLGGRCSHLEVREQSGRAHEISINLLCGLTLDSPLWVVCLSLHCCCPKLALLGGRLVRECVECWAWNPKPLGNPGFFVHSALETRACPSAQAPIP